MADALLRIAGRDYSPYLKLYEQEVGVVDAERVAPQFAGNAALSEGAVWIGDATQNKHWQIGALLRGSSDTGLYPADSQWSTSNPSAFLNAGAVYTASSGQVVCNGAATFEGIAYSLGILPAGTYSFTITVRGNAGGESLRLQAGPTATSA